MKNTQKRHFFIKTIIFPCLWTLGTLTGCASKDALYSDLQSLRMRAYEEWEIVQENKEASKVKLTGLLSLQDGLKVALSHNKKLQAALQEMEIARGVILESYSEALPTVSATYDYMRLDEVASFDVGNTSVSMGDVDNYDAGLHVTQPLFRGGAIPAALRSAQLVSILANEQVRGTVQAVIYDVAKAYYDVLLAQQLYKVNRDAVTSANAHLKDVQIKRDQGVASDFDVLRAQVDVSIFKAQMIQQRNRIHLTKTTLLKSMGASQASEVNLSDSLTYVAMKAVFTEAVRMAYENRSDLYQAELSLKLQNEALRVARSKYWPKVDAWFQEQWSNPDPHNSAVSQWGDAWRAGVSANWSFFDGFKREGRVQQEQERLKKRAVELVDTEEQALLEVQQAILTLGDTEEFVDSQRLNLDRAEEALRLAQVGYRQGIEDTVKVTEARSALTRAQGLYYEAVYSHCLARLVLQRAMGILGPRPGETEPPENIKTRPGEIKEFSNFKNLPENLSQGDRS